MSLLLAIVVIHYQFLVVISCLVVILGIDVVVDVDVDVLIAWLLFVVVPRCRLLVGCGQHRDRAQQLYIPTVPLVGRSAVGAGENVGWLVGWVCINECINA